MGSLALPKPSNLRGAPFGTLVEADVYHICERLQEVSERLVLYALDSPIRVADKTYRFSVVELCADGEQRLVKRFEGLDGRVVESVKELLYVPFEHRFAAAERQEAKAKHDAEQEEIERMYAELGEPMLPELERCNFIQRPVSYRKSPARQRAGRVR